VQIAASQVQPPSPLYLQPEDSFALTINYPTLVGSYSFNLMIRWLRPDGEITPVRKQFTSSSLTTTFNFTLGEGFLLSATLQPVSNFGSGPGIVFCALNIIRDQPETFITMWQLFSDYPSATHLPSWPYGRTVVAQEGPGRIRSITGTTQAAGVDIIETVPAGVRWRLFALRASLTTSVTVASRQVEFTLDDGVNIFFTADQPTGEVASNTYAYVMANYGYAPAPGTFRIYTHIPDTFILLAGYRIRTSTGSLQAGDQWTAPQYLVQEWVDA